MVPTPAEAAALHVLGPQGTPAERRALVVLETSDGGCASADALELSTNEVGVDVHPGPPAGPCARWFTLKASPPRGQVQLEARAGEAVASAAVAMGSERGLAVRLQRRGARLTARVNGAPHGEPVSVVAFFADGSTQLRAASDAWTGSVPPHALVGVVARSGGLTGAAASSTGGAAAGPAVLLLPSDLSVPAAGAPRTAAFLVVTDRHGRLSRNVPLRVRSERGELRALEWLSPGLAAVKLAARAGSPSVDLRAETQGATAQRDLPVVASWPADAQLEVPAHVAPGSPIPVRATVRTVDGAILASDAVAFRCGDGSPVENVSEVSCPESTVGVALVVLVARVDGRLVPLATRSVRVVAPPAPRAPPPPARVPPRPPAIRRLRPRLERHGRRPTLAAMLDVGVDGWGRPVAGAGVRVGVEIGPSFALAGDLRWSDTAVAAPPADPRIVGRATGSRQGVEASVELGAKVGIGAVTLGGFIEAGARYLHDAIRIDNVDATGDGVAPTFGIGAGPSFPVGDRLRLTGAVLVRLDPFVPESVFHGPLVRWLLEARCAYLP